MKTKLIFSLFAAMVMMHSAIASDSRCVYMCTKCDEIVASEVRPNSDKCSKWAHHIWGNLGRVGKNVFICQKCNKVVYTAFPPNCGYSEKYGYHNWIRLGEFAQTIFRCKKCGVSAYLKKIPNGVACPAANGGLHEWQNN